VPKTYRKRLHDGGRVELQVEGAPRTLYAQIDKITEAEAPIDLMVVEADIDDSKLAPDEVRLDNRARVRFADAGSDLNTATTKTTSAAGVNR